MSRNPKIDWKFETKNYLKSELAKLNISREQLADQLQSLGINETKAAIDNKVSRGSFSATFFVQCLSVIKLHVQGMFPINESDLSINEALLAILVTLFDETAEPDIYTSA